MFGKSAIKQFAAALRARMIQPDDPEYEEICVLHNTMIDKRLRLFARCANVGSELVVPGLAL